MAVPKIRESAKPELSYTVRHGITKNRMTYAVATIAEAERHAERLSSEATHTIEIWRGERMVCWYFEGVKG